MSASPRGPRRGGLVAAVFLSLVFSLAAPVPAARAQGDPSRQQFTSGERLAEALTIATGVPISPLLGVSALCGYRWWSTPPQLRHLLPWYYHPGFWGTGLALALLFALNTTIGAAIPGLKKPMDFVEQFENQVSGLVASPIVVVEIVRLLGGAGEPASGALPLSDAGVAALGGLPAGMGWIADFGAGALALTAYFLVFLAFHAIQVLIALSPSALLDFVLRGFRLSFLVLAGMAASVHPYVGAAYGMLLFGVATLIAGWSFRLLVFGSVCGGDLLLRRRATAGAGPIAAFAGGGLGGAPPRSWGAVETDGSVARFRWRPWLLGPRRSVELPSRTLVGRGILSPTLRTAGVVRERMLLRFPPRYRGQEERLASSLGSEEVRDGRIVRGLRAAWAWLSEQVAGGSRSDAAVG